MILVKDINKDIFPTSFLKFLPETCETCGSPTEVLETFSSLQCSNKNCISKVGYRLYSLLEDLGITVLTVDECIEFLRKFDTSNPYSILLYNPEDDGDLFDGCEEGLSEYVYSMLNKRRGMLLWEYIKLGHFDNLSVSSEKLFRNYDSIIAFYKDLNEGGIPFIQNLLLDNTDLVDKASICVDAVLIYETFVSYKEDIEEGLKGVVILKPDYKFPILFANDVVEYESNVEFLFDINRKLKNKVYLYPVYSLSEDVSFIYWNSNFDENSIIVKAKEDYPHIKIVNESTIFNSLLQEVSRNG